MRRRDFVLGPGASLVPGLAKASTAQRRGRQPNILLVMSDQHSQQVAGAFGNTLARTPNIDRLADQGVTFENAYCNSPQCAPSRLSFTSGKYVHRVSAWNNYCRLASDGIPSLPRIMNAAGYDSVLCGKQHYDRRHRYGFAEIGGNLNDHDQTGRGERRNADDTTASALHTHLVRPSAGEDSTVLEHDRTVTAAAVDFLSKRDPAGRPFFLFVGFLAPHPPYRVPAKYWEAHRGKPPMPVIPDGFLDGLPLNYKHLRRAFGVVDVDETRVRRARELYYGLTQWMDENTGTVLSALGARPFADNTVIIYTTDHGENLGEHGLWFKNAMYEQAARVPLIMSWPRRWKGGQRRRGACSLLDMVQTISGIGGANAPEDWNGNSMLPWIDDGATHWKDMAVTQYYGVNIASGYSMLRTGPWKYVYHSAPDGRHPPERELYNLEADPREFLNLAKQASQQDLLQRLHAVLLKELGEDPEETEHRCRFEIAKGYAD